MLRRLAAGLAIALTWGTAAMAAMATCEPGSFVVAVDPGHTVAQPGATSARGVPEVQFNDRLGARIVAALHDAGFVRSFLTRRGDGEITLQQRAQIAELRGAKLLLSVHHDSAQPHKLLTWVYRGQPRAYTDQISGFSLFVSTRNAEPARSEAFARLLGERLLAACQHPTLHHAEPIAGEGCELLDARIGLYRFDELAVLRLAPMPAVLFEAGVIVHRDDERQLRSKAQQRRTAAAVAAAVADFCAERPAAAGPAPACRVGSK